METDLFSKTNFIASETFAVSTVGRRRKEIRGKSWLQAVRRMHRNVLLFPSSLCPVFVLSMIGANASNFAPKSAKKVSVRRKIVCTTKYSPLNGDWSVKIVSSALFGITLNKP